LAKGIKSQKGVRSRSTNADFVIITALEEERDAVLSKCGRTQKLDKDSPDVHTYYRCEVKSTRKDGSRYDVIVTTLLNMGPTDAATGAAAIVNRWKPKYVLLVGIACGIRGEAEHGDILIANQVADYTLGKQQDGRRKVRWSATLCGASLLDSAMNLSKAWQRRIGIQRPGSGEPQRRKGVVASGGDVIADDQIIAAYTDDWPKLVGIEMEAGGVAYALHQTADRPEFLMIKGVSDFGRDKHDPDVLPWRAYACHAAAAFARGLIESGPSAKVVEDVEADDEEDEKLRSAERRWNYLQHTPLRGLEVLLLLKNPVGKDWFSRVLDDTRISLSRDGPSFSLSRTLSLAGPPNTREHSPRWEETTCSFWERYEHDRSYWVRRIAPDPVEFEVVCGFDAAIPWKELAVPSTVTLGDLGPMTHVGMSLPPEAFKPGVEEFKLTFVGDQFSFSLCLSDHGLEFLHEMANTHNQLSGFGKGAPISLGTHLDGIQLLETFREQLMPGWKPARHAGQSIFSGLGGPNGRAITFYPAMPASFHKTDEAKTNYTITLNAPDLEAGKTRVRELEAAVQESTASAEIYGELAARYSREGRVAEAIDCLEQALAKIQPTVDLYGLLGELLCDLGRFEEALIPLREGLRLSSDNAGIHAALGASLATLGRLGEAFPHFEVAVRLEPLKSRHHANLGRALAVQERYAEALSAYERGSELSPDNIEILELLGVLYNELGRTGDAESSFTKATQVAPDDVQVHQNLGRHLAIHGAPERAIPVFKRALEIQPSMELYDMLGRSFGQLERWPEAETSFREAIALASDDAALLRSLGICIMKQGRLDEAIKVLLQHMRLVPDDHEIEQLIAELRAIAAGGDMRRPPGAEGAMT
jgi:tetratricopeptide (TPR) repeat protein/nucleoside phosphorylase